MSGQAGKCWVRSSTCAWSAIGDPVLLPLDDEAKDEGTSGQDDGVQGACAASHLVDGLEAVDDGEGQDFPLGN
jgi:hypothetical protein